MGNKISTSRVSFEDWSSENLADAVRGLGKGFDSLATLIVDNGIDAGILETEIDLRETLQDLEVSRLHARVLTKAWNRVRETDQRQKQEMNRTFESSKKRPRVDPEKTTKVIQELDLSPSTPDQELKGFKKVPEWMLAKFPRALYVGIHLWHPEGHEIVSGCLKDDTTEFNEVPMDWVHIDKAVSKCHDFLSNSEDFYMEDPNSWHEGKKFDYHGYALCDDDDTPLGVLCAIFPPDSPAEPDDRVEEILRDLKRQAEEELAVRKTLVARRDRLIQQIEDMDEHMRESKEEREILPPVGPVAAVTLSDVRGRASVYPNSIGARASIRASELEVVKAARTNREEDLILFPEEFYAKTDAEGLDRTPIGKGEMERLAVYESLELDQIRSNDPAGIAMKKLVHMAAVAFGVKYGEITMLSQSQQFSFARYFATDEIAELAQAFYDECNADDSTGESWLTVADRCGMICNYTVALRKQFVVHDMAKDPTFEHFPMRFYAGTPVWIRGQPLMIMCLLDPEPKPNFGKAHEVQLERFAALIAQHVENWLLKRESQQLERIRLSSISSLSNSFSSSSQHRSAPEGNVAIVFTDIQGSTALWEYNHTAMDMALVLHNHIIRQCCTEFNGFEIMTEGDAFHLAFHDAIDAVNFALKVQDALHEAPWSEEILAHPDANDDASGSWRGLRVRIGISWGEVETKQNDVTGRLQYVGTTVHVAKSMECMAHGGQILVSGDVWTQCSHVNESMLGSPQVLDLGVHVVRKGDMESEGVMAKRVLQLLPASLAVDYYSLRKESISRVNGRRFPRVLTKKQLTTSFEDAPHEGNRVAILFVNTCAIESKCPNGNEVLGVLSKWIGTLLSVDYSETGFSGYQCKNFMLAFPSALSAVQFGLHLLESIASGRSAVLETSIAHMLQVGVMDGSFTTMEPDPATGRADYFGKVVNRAARVAGSAVGGSVYLGSLDLETAPDLEFDDVRLEFVCNKTLKGVSGEAALYRCIAV